MVSSKKPGEMSNGTTKYPPSNMLQRKDTGGVGGKLDGRAQNGIGNSFRTDSAISGARIQGERTLQRWVPDAVEDVDNSLESARMRSSGAQPWDQFAENERRFGVTTDYDENIYTTTIDKSHPQYKQRLAEAEKKAREIEKSSANNSHVAEERITDNVDAGDGIDEEDRYSGVRRQDFPPLSSSSNKYTPPAKRPPVGMSTVSGAPVDPAIISSQLARPDKPTGDQNQNQQSTKPTKIEDAPTPAPSTDTVSAVQVDTKPNAVHTPASSSRTASPAIRPEGVPNATATVERDVTNAFKGFAAQQRTNVEKIRVAKAKNDKEVKLNDLKRFADNFKLLTPVPSDLVSIIAKDPAKQKEIQEKAKRNAEEAKINPTEAVKPVAPTSDPRIPQRPAPATHGSSPSNGPGRQNGARTNNLPHQNSYNVQAYRNDRPSQSQNPPVAQQSRQPGNLGQRLRSIEQSKHGQPSLNIAPIHDSRLPPTGPSNTADPNFSRRSSGVMSAHAARLNPNSSEFRPSPHAASFNPSGKTSTGSSPRSAINAVAPTPPIARSLLKRKPVPESQRPPIKDKLDALEHIKAIKPPPGKNWKATGDMKPAYDTPPTWRQITDDEKSDSNMHLTYDKLFDRTPFPAQTLSTPNPSHAVPQVPHQHQLPFHLQSGMHSMAMRQSPRQPPMNIHGNQHGHGPNMSFNGPDDHRMVPSHSAQSFASPRLQSLPMAYPSPMNQPAQLAYNPQMMPYPGAPPMQQYRSLSQSHQLIPQQAQMGPAFMMQNPANGFIATQAIAPGPQMMYSQNGQGHFMPSGNGQPSAMPGVNGYPSPGRGAPMMMNQGSQQGQQQHMYSVNPGMSPGVQYGNVAPMYPQHPPGQMPMRGFPGPNQFGTSPQQMHQFVPQHRYNHQNGHYNNNKNFQPHSQHANTPPSNQIPAGPQTQASDLGDEAK